MRTYLARLSIALILAVVGTIAVVTLTAVAQGKNPPPTPSAKQPIQPSAPTGGGSPNYDFSTYQARGSRASKKFMEEMQNEKYPIFIGRSFHAQDWAESEGTGIYCFAE